MTRGELLDSRPVDLRESTQCNFAETKLVEFETCDEDGKPIAGAKVAQESWIAHARTPLLRSMLGMHVGRRVVAESDAQGRARGRMVAADADTLAVCRASSPARASDLSGIWGGRRVVDGKLTDDEPTASLRLTLRRREHAELHLRGRPASASLWIAWTGLHDLDGGRMHASLRESNLPVPITADTDSVAAFGNDGMRGAIGGTETNPIPLRIAALSAGKQARLPDIDLGALRTVDVTVVDGEGTAVPFAPATSTCASYCSRSRRCNCRCWTPPATPPRMRTSKSSR